MAALHTFSADSIGAYADQIADWESAGYRAPGAGEASAREENPEFFGDMSLARAISTGQRGGYWPEALADMKPLPVDQARLLEGRALDVPALTADVQGFAPIVPNYLIGVPDSMLTFTPDPTPNKVLRIGVGIVHLSMVNKQSIFSRGNAILSVIDALEMIGFSCELVACWTAHTAAIDTAIEVTIKHADQHWDPASVAFSLCHAAFGRRLGFRYVEATPAVAPITHEGYGGSLELDPAGFDITIDPMTSNTGYKTRAAALNTVLDNFLGQLAAKGIKGAGD